MADTTTTLEDASHCPKCGNPGEERSTVNLGREKGQMHYFYCVTELCLWFDTPWMVQTRSDGLVPVRDPLSNVPGDFASMVPSKDMVAHGRRIMEDILGKTLIGTEIDEGKR